ncbi:DNA-directed DNA polymerase [Fragilaria crotonensis]|nr:DNA-directed DNA polymerase [Fragilaria crotonensis]
MVGEKLNVTTLGQLAQVSLVTLTSTFSDDMARFLYDIGRGICRDAVTTRTKPKSISCGKTFRGKLAITDSERLRKWTEELCEGLLERVSADRDQHNRMPKLLMTSIHFNSSDSHVSKSGMAPRSLESFSKVCVDLMEKLAATKPDTPIIGLTVAATTFVDVAKGSASITAAFNRTVASDSIGLSNVCNPPMSDHESKRSVKPASAMDQWLQSQSAVDEKKATDCRTVFSSVVSQKADRPGGTIQRFLSNHSLTSPSNDLMCADQDIDPEVWRELPEDVRISLQKEWEAIPRRPLQARPSVASIAKRTSQANFTTAHDIDPEVWNELRRKFDHRCAESLENNPRRLEQGLRLFSFLPNDDGSCNRCFGAFVKNMKRNRLEYKYSIYHIPPVEW